MYRHPWTAICTLHGLTAILGERTLVPTLRSVTVGTTCDVVAVQILIGQSVADWQIHGHADASPRSRPDHVDAPITPQIPLKSHTPHWANCETQVTKL